MTTGRVYLVGAGPGDPGLLTLRGAEVLRQADLVLYDGLANPLLLQMTNGICERTARTRSRTERVVPQHEVNDRLVEAARSGNMVVRLKGGDPYIFGRGSEEAAALEAAGVPYEVIPGITAATAAGEYAGFSFTHREIASAVAFVTGHEDPSRDASRLNYKALAEFPGTLVFYMGLGRVESICRDLQAHGKPASTPAAVICRASLPQQKVVTSTLAELPKAVSDAGLKPPSLIVVGECVNLRHANSWFESRPLFGLKVGITRPAHQCQTIADRITELSGEPVIMPLISIGAVTESEAERIETTLAAIETFDWLVFTSVNGVTEFMRHLWESGRDVRSLSDLKLAAIGTSTASALRDHGLRADVVPETFRAEALAESMASRCSGRRVLWARASRGRDVLITELENAGAEVTELVVYCNDDIDQFDTQIRNALRTGGIDWIGLSSPSIARQMARLLNDEGLSASSLSTKFACISPVTAAAAREAGLTVAVEASTHTWDGIIDAIGGN